MKKYIKISLIAVIAIGIICSIVYFISGIGSGGDKIIATTSFEKQIQARTDAEIKGKEYNDAQTGFNSILQEINTEASVTLGDGTKNLTEAEVQKAKKIVFYEYAPIFTKYGKAYFKKSSWDDSVLKSLRSEAQILQTMNIAEKGTAVYSDLLEIATNVDDYYAAWGVAKSASHCSTVSAIASLMSSANRYKKDPLMNNASLAAALNSVESNAKSSVIRVISSHCRGVANRYASYSDYASWTNAYESACDRINEYKKSYGYPADLQSARAALDDADNNALNYYDN